MQSFTNILEAATKAIPCDYFQLAIEGGDPIYRERVYCYELYHQMRRIWPDPGDTPFRLNGEVDKRGHPILKKLEMGLSMPDFLVHGPGNMKYNYAVVEVKPQSAEKDGIAKDLRTLAEFVNVARYERAVYLLYGHGVSSTIERVKAVANGEAIFKKIELWAHAGSGKEAVCIGALT